MSPSRFLIGIDLGTTNSAVAYIDTKEAAFLSGSPQIHIFEIPQLVAEGEVRAVSQLPSFLYFANDQEHPSGSLRLPWDQEQKQGAVGVFAREQGALVPGRLVSSAKSWLSLSSVDRTAKILPWGADKPEQACSPVEASTKYLMHIRHAWNYTFANDSADADDLRFERQEIVLTVPASFDEEARELTVQAARDAGFEKLTLLEEPLAAFYAWIAANRRSLKKHLKDNYLVLICDVGGGTADFSLIRVRIIDKEVRFERTAIGEHLLLGGDNVDLALARRVEEKLGNPKLTIRQQNALRRQCSAAKERLLSDHTSEQASITVLGGGRSVIGGTLTTELSRQDVIQTLLDGFLPLTGPDQLPARDKRTGLRELGLPYATDPAITKHLAAFLTKSSESGVRSQNTEHRTEKEEAEDTQYTVHSTQYFLSRPDAILFNGGFFAPEITRERIVEAVAGWFREKGKRWRPKVLTNAAPESAVAIGAAYYGHVRHGAGLRISGGSGRGYYIGVHTGDQREKGRIQAVCVMPRGTEEGTALELSNREFMVLTNRPVSFTLYSSTTRHDAQGDVVALDEEEAHRHAPLITVLRYGKRSRHIELGVQLKAIYTEVGTLELWCEAPKTGHRWRLQFQLRGVEEVEEEAEEQPIEESQTFISDEAVQASERLIRAVFGGPRDAIEGEAITPESLTGRLESAIGYRKDAWPMAAIRKLCDVLADVAAGRKKGRQYEARWLNLFGFCLRPGFGAALDDWRINQARRAYLEGLAHPKDLQCQVEWLILWRRVAGGLNSGQQQELYQRQTSTLGIGGRKPPGKINRQLDQEGWLLLASLDHLDSSVRVKLGEELIKRIKDEPDHKGYLWSIGRLGARIPFYGPLNCVVPAEQASRWIKTLLKLPEINNHVASAIAQLGARTDDALRDVEDDLRQEAIKRLTAAGISDELIHPLREHVPPTRADAVRIFGESLPEGLRLVG